MIESPERHFWTMIEPLHAVTYFAPEAAAAFENAGLRGFWRGYFAGRASPLGAVQPAVVTALFHGFHPSFVERAVPDVWSRCTPADAVSARLDGVDATWATHLAESDRQRIKRAAFILQSAVQAVADDRRPMFAANAALDIPGKPHLALWHAATTLREHRGDGHLAALVVHDLDPCESHILRIARSGLGVETIKPHRGWSDEDWIAAAGRLFERELLDEVGNVSERGVEVHDNLEKMTDALARQAVSAIQNELAELTNTMTPIVAALASTVIPYPNPMGLEPFDPA